MAERPRNVRIGALDDLVIVRSAFFAVVFFWCYGLIIEAHAATMLPDMAIVALDKEITNIIRESWWER